jgi:hypothetical protein
MGPAARICHLGTENIDDTRSGRLMHGMLPSFSEY